MHIEDTVTPKAISAVICNLTQEAMEQVAFYGYHNLNLKLLNSMQTCDECGTFVNSKGIPIAVFGVRHKDPYDSLFLVISKHCTTEYRQFSREARKWLYKRSKPVRCTLPTLSVKTLRMIDRWGFKEVCRTSKLKVTLEYSHEG